MSLSWFRSCIVPSTEKKIYYLPTTGTSHFVHKSSKVLLVNRKSLLIRIVCNIVSVIIQSARISTCL